MRVRLPGASAGRAGGDAVVDCVWTWLFAAGLHGCTYYFHRMRSRCFVLVVLKSGTGMVTRFGSRRETGWEIHSWGMRVIWVKGVHVH